VRSRNGIVAGRMERNINFTDAVGKESSEYDADELRLLWGKGEYLH